MSSPIHNNNKKHVEEEAMAKPSSMLDQAFKRVKRLKLLEPCIGVSGFFLVTAAIVMIWCFFYLDYREVVGVFGFKGQFDIMAHQKRGSIAEEGSSSSSRVDESGCDLFKGNWVWDENYPLYESKDCRFIDDGFRCSESGRPDLYYTKWRWQPKHCNLPSWQSRPGLWEELPDSIPTKHTLRDRGCYFQEGMEVKLEMKVEDAYKRSIETVLNWIQDEVNHNKTQVFFRTYAPVHFRGGDWKNGGGYHLETLPELGALFVPNDNWSQFKIANSVLSEHTNTREFVKVLNVTQMTGQRKDGHSSIYYLGPNKGAALGHRQDCSHWCLPGVPDTWNELLYAMLMKHEGFS